MSKIKLIIFDLDGVLVEANKIHYEALNEAVGKEYAIDWEEHLSTFNGLKTHQKLVMLTEQKGLPVRLHNDIWRNKQKITLKKLKGLKPDQALQALMGNLVNEGYRIAVCSNSIRKTCLTVLHKLGLVEFLDLIISNEDVKNSKPHPEMYWKAISTISCLPRETLIIEDSPYGVLAAIRSNAHLLKVKNPSEVTYSNILDKLTAIEIEDE